MLAGKKKLFDLAHIIKIKHPAWPEFSNKAVWIEAKKNPNFMQYIPDNWTIEEGKRHPDKDYTWAIISTL